MSLRDLFGGGRGKVLAFCWLGWVFDFYDLILFAFVAPVVEDELGLTAVELGWLHGATLAAAAFGGFGFGRLADRVGRRFALTASILVYSIGAFVTAFSLDFWTLLAARLVTGIGVGGEWGVGHAIVAETYPAHLRGRAAGILQAGSPVAMALAAAVGCFAAPVIGWRWCFLLSGLPALMVFFARRALPGPDRAPGRSSGRLVDVVLPPYWPGGVALLLVLVLHMTGFWCTYAWLPRELIRSGGVSIAFVGWFQIGINAFHVVADVSFGFLADRFGRRRMFVAYCLLFAAGLVAVALGFERLRDDLVLLGFVLGAVGLGAGTWSCFGTLFAEIYAPEVRATAASGFYNLSRGVQLVTQPLMGMLLMTTGTFAAALYVGAATALLSAACIPFVRVRDRAH